MHILPQCKIHVDRTLCLVFARLYLINNDASATDHVTIYFTSWKRCSISAFTCCNARTECL